MKTPQQNSTNLGGCREAFVEKTVLITILVPLSFLEALGKKVTFKVTF